MRVVGSEAELCVQVARYLRLKHPKVPFHFDYGAGLKMTMSQAVRQKMLNSPGWPDLFIAQPVGRYAGLFIELKKEGTRLRKRTGEWATDHIAEQAAVADELAGRSYIAQSCVGLEDTLLVIDTYLAKLDDGSRWSGDVEWPDHPRNDAQVARS